MIVERAQMPIWFYPIPFFVVIQKLTILWYENWYSTVHQDCFINIYRKAIWKLTLICVLCFVFIVAAKLIKSREEQWMTKLMAFEFLLLKYLHERWTEKRSYNMQMKICEHWTVNRGKKRLYRTKQRPIFLINAIYKQYLSTDSPIWLNKLSFSFAADIFHWIHDILII